MVKFLTTAPDVVDLGDTKDVNGNKVRVSAAAWSKFLGGVIAE